ncbi:MAG TPA: GNAT family N-acetyltransferase [Candidatus Yaniella excrementigallinarum]|nr:GNAT family N-acetyltransferase [Candidatus Yaniella excrementigallinarum]
MVEIQNAHWTQMRHETAYNIARLRYRVYTMEQGITTVEELDGRDLEPTTQVWWIQIEGVPVSTLRVLRESPHTRSIGRVATDKNFRGHGLASALIRAVLAYYPDQRLTMHAQSHLEDWYETFGLKRVGEPFYEAGLEHITMAREPMLPQDGTLGVDTELGAVNEDTPSDVDHGTPEPGTPQYFEDLQRRYRMRRSRKSK